MIALSRRKFLIGTAAATVVAALPAPVRAVVEPWLPQGWLICDGRAVSRKAYSDLFKIVGCLYGGDDGQGTFNLPDFRPRYPVNPRYPVPLIATTASEHYGPGTLAYFMVPGRSREFEDLLNDAPGDNPW